MRIPIAAKIGGLASVLVTLVGVIVCWIAYVIGMNLLEEHERIDLRDETTLNGKEIQNQVATMREDLFHLSAHPAVRGLIRSAELDAADATAADDTSELVTAIEETFERTTASSARNRPYDPDRQWKPYARIRFVGGTTPRELVRMDRQHGQSPQEVTAGAGVVPSPLYLAAMGLQAPRAVLGDVQIDNELGGRVILPAAVPVYDEAGDFFGVIAIDLDFAALQEEWLNSARHLTFLTDASGNFLVHPSRPLIENIPPESAGDDGANRARVQEEALLADELSRYFGDSPDARFERNRVTERGRLIGDEPIRAPEEMNFTLVWLRTSNCSDDEWDYVRERFHELRHDPANLVKVPDPDRPRTVSCESRSAHHGPIPRRCGS
jgi:hypothetical protein